MGCAMSAGQPYYALHPHALNGRRAPRSIEAMAADYLVTLQTLQPDGPYFLGGVSIGGTVAFEMAQQMRRQGHEVALLVMIDPTNPQGCLIGRENVRQRLRGVGRKIVRLICERYLAAGRRVPPCLRLPYFIDVSVQVGRVYVPQVYPGRVIFFRAEQTSEDLPAAWRKLVTGAWESHVIPGDHFGLFQEPHGRILAEHLALVLNQVLST
jgi:thioesterase domain-containing protein